MIVLPDASHPGTLTRIRAQAAMPLRSRAQLPHAQRWRTPEARR